jgi:hypothetical protein
MELSRIACRRKYYWVVTPLIDVLQAAARGTGRQNKADSQLLGVVNRGSSDREVLKGDDFQLIEHKQIDGNRG